MIFGNTYKILFRNTLIGGVGIAIFAGALVTFIELRRIDNYLADITPKESEKFFKLYEKFYFNRTNKSLSGLKQATKKSLDEDFFVYVEFLDDQLKKVIQVSINDYGTIVPRLNMKFGDIKMTGRFNHKIIYLKGQVFIKVMVPIVSQKAGKHIGHFQGIYHLSDDKFSQIKKQSYFSIFITIIAVLVTVMFIYPIIRSLQKKILMQSFELLRSNTDILKSFGSAIAERDSDTSSHNYRVTIYSVRLAEALGLTSLKIRALIKGALLHDIGKIGISDAILLKPGKLSHEEFEKMKQHVAIGVKIIQYNDWLQDALDVVRFHHEKFDGSGYLSGKKGDDIPVNAKIFAICDVFDALTSKRPYKNPFPIEQSLAIMKEDSEKHFDPEYLNAFEKIVYELFLQVSRFETEGLLAQQLNQILRGYFKVHL
ncbi:MAG: HD-GYP domain-containing protein [Desulfobacula sp.]|nr:HD-GYP domain-containing protein [Desulfobacula sp.]